MNIHKTLAKIISLLAKWRLPELTARVLSPLTVSLYRPPRTNVTGVRPYRALVLTPGKEEFWQDVEASLVESGKFELVRWPSYAMRTFSAPILPSSLKHDNYMLSGSDAEARKKEYREFLRRLWVTFCSSKRIDLVLSANFGYSRERELATVVEASGIPFIVLQKENLNGTTEVRRKYWSRIYREGRGPFSGRKILVFNESERDLEIEADVVKPRNVVVTGMPRMDRIHHWRRRAAGVAKKTNKPQILFFTFSRHEKLPAGLTALHDDQQEAAGGNGGESDAPNWGGFFEDTHRAIMMLARKRPDLTVVVKTKGIKRHGRELYAVLQPDGGELPSNLKVVSGGDPFRLLTDSDVVIGFNTTGLLEALAAGKPAIVPSFGEAHAKTLCEFVMNLGDAVEYALSPEEIIEKACRYVDRPPEIPSELSPEISKALRFWTGNDDGQSGRRVFDAIIKEVEKSAGNPDAPSLV